MDLSRSAPGRRAIDVAAHGMEEIERTSHHQRESRSVRLRVLVESPGDGRRGWWMALWSIHREPSAMKSCSALPRASALEPLLGTKAVPSELAASPPLSLSLSLSLQVARSNPAVICSSDSFPMSTQFPRHIGPAPGCCCIAQPAGEEQAKPGKREGKWRWPALFARVKGELEITKGKGRKRRPRGLTGGGRGTSRWW